MASINTANDEQTHNALYRLEGYRAVIHVTYKDGERERFTGRIGRSVWRNNPRGLYFCADGEGYSRFFTFDRIESINLLPVPR